MHGRRMPAVVRMPAPAAAMPGEPDAAPNFRGVILYKELRALGKQFGFANRDARSLLITRLLAMDQIRQKRAHGDPEAES